MAGSSRQVAKGALQIHAPKFQTGRGTALSSLPPLKAVSRNYRRKKEVSSSCPCGSERLESLLTSAQAPALSRWEESHRVVGLGAAEGAGPEAGGGTGGGAGGGGGAAGGGILRARVL